MEGILEGRKKVGSKADRHEGRRGRRMKGRKRRPEEGKIFRTLVRKERRRKGGSRKKGGKDSKEEWKA